MKLNRANLNKIKSPAIAELPFEALINLPEKVLQFGTGVLLRGLPDFLIDRANKQGLFNGRIVVVKSTANGDTANFDEQDCLYTVCIRGQDDGKPVEENHLVSSISRVVSATRDWEQILACAVDPGMELVISNTTEVGIALTQDNIHQSPPSSFPGKLVAILYNRYKFFKGDPEKGMIIIPTELIAANGELLKSIVLELAHQNNLEKSFSDWIESANSFCNSLVDRIVPGQMKVAEQEVVETRLGYKDELMIVAEVYSLWAIETDNPQIKDKLSFANVNQSVITAANIEKFRELKLRLLNGVHTFSCGLAVLSGFDTVKDAMDDDDFAGFISGLIYDEMIPAIEGKYFSPEEAKSFAAKVLDRFRNSFIEHRWLNITVQYTTKMAMRNVSVMMGYQDRFGYLPPHMALGLAAHILFMRSTQEAFGGNFYGNVNGVKYLITDELAEIYTRAWEAPDKRAIVSSILANEYLWHTSLNDFTDNVTEWLEYLLEHGSRNAIKHVALKKYQPVKMS